MSNLLSSLFPQAAYGRREEFFMFGCIMEATMIDRRMSDKAIQVFLNNF